MLGSILSYQITNLWKFLWHLRESTAPTQVNILQGQDVLNQIDYVPDSTKMPTVLVHKKLYIF